MSYKENKLKTITQIIKDDYIRGFLSIQCARTTSRTCSP